MGEEGRGDEGLGKGARRSRFAGQAHLFLTVAVYVRAILTHSDYDEDKWKD
jgi:hypothetical protein